MSFADTLRQPLADSTVDTPARTIASLCMSTGLECPVSGDDIARRRLRNGLSFEYDAEAPEGWRDLARTFYEQSPALEPFSGVPMSYRSARARGLASAARAERRARLAMAWSA